MCHPRGRSEGMTLVELRMQSMFPHGQVVLQVIDLSWERNTSKQRLGFIWIYLDLRSESLRTIRFKHPLRKHGLHSVKKTYPVKMAIEMVHLGGRSGGGQSSEAEDRLTLCLTKTEDDL